MSEALKQFLFSHNGAQYVARIYADDSMGAPWKEHDGHGPVRETRQKASKRPGERVLYSDRGNQWLYDWQAACKLARRDGWDAEPIGAPGRIERAVQADFDRLRGWLRNDWQWVGVGVARVDSQGEFPDDDREFYSNALWGIESDSPEYHREIAAELAGECTQ